MSRYGAPAADRGEKCAFPHAGYACARGALASNVAAIGKGDMSRDDDQDRQAESQRIIGRVGLESEASMARRVADRVGGHMSGRDAESGDRIELWGTRIGRWLGVALLAYVLWWLFDFMAAGG